MIKEIAELIESLSSFAWPLVFVVVMILYRKAISKIFDSFRPGKMTIKIGDKEITLEELREQESKFTSELASNVGVIQKQLEELGVSRESSPRIEETLAKEKSRPKTILWVDDNPKNNTFIVELLEKKGIVVDFALSTKEGLRKYRNRHYDAIISDIGRLEAGEYIPDAGIKLLLNIRKNDSEVPIHFFTSKRGVSDYGPTAVENGAMTVTESSMVLLKGLDF